MRGTQVKSSFTPARRLFVVLTGGEVGGELLAGSAARELALLAFAVRVGAIVAAFKASRSVAASRQVLLAGDAGIRVCLPTLVPFFADCARRAVEPFEVVLQETGTE